MLQPTNGYIIRLANGQGWHIVGTNGARPWLEKLARIMELKSCELNSYRRLIFFRGESGRRSCEDPTLCLAPDIGRDLPRSGWKAHDLKSLQLWYHSKLPDVICEIGHATDRNLDIVRMWLALYPIYHRAQESGGLPLHGALLECNGIGVSLAAAAGTGKSTCCRRLPRPWRVRCDDEILIVRDDRKRYFAHPLPTWTNCGLQHAERTWNVQRHVPFSAIFFLEQAEADEAVPIGQGQAAAFIYQLATEACRRGWRNLDRKEERHRKEKLFDNACEIARAVPACILRVSLSGRFWEEMENALIKHGMLE